MRLIGSWLRLKTHILYGVFIRLDIPLLGNSLDEYSLDIDDVLDMLTLYLRDKISYAWIGID